MKFKAIAIKTWIMVEVSPMGWASLITRAMPELLEHNNKFSAYFINERTLWSEMEIDIINWYLRKMYSLELPSDILTANVQLRINYLDAIEYTMFEIGKRWRDHTSKLLEVLKVNNWGNHEPK